jgi:hypothetical protein
MARTKKDDTSVASMIDSSKFEAADCSVAEKLTQAFDRVMTVQYGYARAPEPYITPFGIKHLDGLLGGGIISSAPVVLSSTPETGKSTFAFQFSKVFQDIYPNSIIVYLDIEGAANASGAANKDETDKRMSRIHVLGIDRNRFRYEPVVIDIYNFFKMIESLVEVKKQFEEKIQKEFKVLIIWDSIAATPCSKLYEVDDPNRIIGVKARQLSFCIEKYAPLLAYNRITFLTIDQVRANLQLEGQYVAKEKSVGTWNDYKAASSVVAFNHKVGQWLFLSRKATITPKDGMGISGWYINVTTEKNKLAPSQESIMCVFDKRTGLHKFWSEYTFLSEMTRNEVKYFKDEKNLRYPLSMRKSGPQVFLEFIDPTSGEKQYSSDKFYRKDAYNRYLSDEQFKAAFDYVMNVSVEHRINNGLFQLGDIKESMSSCDDDSLSESDVDLHESDPPEVEAPEPVDDNDTYQSAFD